MMKRLICLFTVLFAGMTMAASIVDVCNVKTQADVDKFEGIDKTRAQFVLTIRDKKFTKYEELDKYLRALAEAKTDAPLSILQIIVFMEEYKKFQPEFLNKSQSYARKILAYAKQRLKGGLETTDEQYVELRTEGRFAGQKEHKICKIKQCKIGRSS